MKTKSLVVAVALQVVGIGGCQTTSELPRESDTRRIARELAKVQPTSICPASEAERPRFANEQAERARLEALRFRVDARAPYRAAKAASLSLACTHHNGAEHLERQVFAKKSWELFLVEAKVQAHRVHVSVRAEDAAAEARALRELAVLVQEALPELSSGMAQRARRLEDRI
jgi:hypothetical protein